MTNSEIIALAKEAGMYEPDTTGVFQAYVDLRKGTELFLAAGAVPGQPMAASTPLKYNPIPVYTSDCVLHPDAPHGVDVEASWKAGKSVCLCKDWYSRIDKPF